MANGVYDPEKEGDLRYHPHNPDPLDNKPAGNPNNPLDDVRQAEKRGSTGSAGGDNFRFNPHGDDDGEDGDSSAESPGFLRDAEGEGGEGGKGGGESFVARSKSRMQKFTGSLSSNKLLVGVGFSSGIFIIILVLFLLIFLGNYKIVQLGEHIASYRFARVTKNYADSVGQITAEDTALSTADQNTLQKAASQFASVRDSTWGSMWDKINNYRPDKIVENFKQDGVVDFKYESGGATSLWKKKLTGIVINGQEITPADAGRWNKLIHPFQTRAAQGAVSDELNAKLATAMQDRSSIIRGAVAKSIRDELGIKLNWWQQMTKYRGATPEEANALVEAESEKTISNGIKPAPSEVSSISDGAQKTQDAINQCADSAPCLKEEVNNGGTLPKTAASEIESATSSSVFTQAASSLNLAYTIALPVCLVYDGSLANPGSGQKQTVDNTSTQDTRSYYAVESAADKQKDGYKMTGEAAGAMDWKAGDITKSVPEQHAAGLNVNTSDELQPQANSNQTLGNSASIFSFLPLGSGLADSFANASCPVITNIWFGIAGGIGTLGLGFFSGGTSEIATQGLTTALKTYMQDFIASAFTKKEGVKLGLTVGGVVGATELAKMLVAQKAAANDNGFATGSAFDNAADRGGDLNAQQTSQRMYGRPLTNAEVAQSNISDQSFQSSQLANESFTQRYFALTNPDSLASKFGLDLSAHINGTVLSSLLRLGSNVLNPTSSFATIFGGMNKQVALAGGTMDNQNYGIVQWGFSDDEESLIKSDPSYGPLANEKILSGITYQGQQIADYITSKYSKCWGYDTSGQPDPSVTMGTLLTDGSLVRDNTGNVTGGLCSPANLGVNSADPAAYDPTNGKNDLIFRYRVMKNYETVIDNLLNYQDVTAADATEGSAAPSPTLGDSSSYQNPLRDVKSLRPERIDMGVDYAGSGPVYALGPGTITNLTNSGWDYGGYDAFIGEKLDSGAAAGLYNYVAEACVPVPGLHIGQHVDSNTVICNMINPGSTGIETGWAADGGQGDTLAVSKGGGYQEGYATKSGENYNDLLVSLGAPSGTQQTQMGTLPPGLPKWQ